MSDKTQPRDEQPCDWCDCPLDPHILVPLGDNPLEGGLAFCPSCECVFTWDVDGYNTVTMPPAGVVEQYRHALQAQGALPSLN